MRGRRAGGRGRLAVGGGRQPLQPQRIETDRALAADAVVDRELELGAVAKHAVRARSPGLDDVPLLVAHRRPLRRELVAGAFDPPRSEEHTSELQSLMRIPYAVFCFKQKHKNAKNHTSKKQ